MIFSEGGILRSAGIIDSLLASATTVCATRTSDACGGKSLFTKDKIVSGMNLAICQRTSMIALNVWKKALPRTLLYAIPGTMEAS